MLLSICRLLVLLISYLSGAVLATYAVEADDQIEVDLILHSDELADEQSIWVGFQIQLAPGWHIYWKNSGESGYPTTVGWELPKGWKAGTLQFPAPYLYEYEGMTGYALENNFTLLTKVKGPLQVDDSVRFEVTLDALVCNESTCLPYQKSFLFNLDQLTNSRQNDSQSLIQLAKSRLPIQKESISVYASFLSGGVEMSLSSPVFDEISPAKMQFFPENPFILVDHQNVFSRSSDGSLGIRLKFLEQEGLPPSQVSGVLTYPEWNQAWHISVSTEEPEDSQVSTFMPTEPLATKSEFQLLYSLLALVCLGMAAWAYGKGSSPHKFSKNWYMFACLSLLGGLWLAYPHKSSSMDKSALSWQPWSPQLQDKLLSEGKAVYIDYTAKWCLSCQVNKRVYQDDSVQDALRDQDVHLLRADWTQKSPEILQSLQSYGREGVPFNVFYPATTEGERSLAVILPEVLTIDNVVHTIQTGQENGSSSFQANNFLVLLGFGWLGGVILNIMPCVFPVIGLKIMSFVKQASEDLGMISRHGVIFTLGVLLSFWFLVAILLLLREGMQQQLGWGFQLQEPIFVLILAAFLFLFGLSLSGVFEIGFSVTGVGAGLTQKAGLTGSFFSGVLATVVATPCMAPFLGVAVGAALAMEPIYSFAIFTSIAIGLSTPYLLLSLYPQWLQKLPKPGVWMETFKQFMAFPIYATVAWLIWTLDGLIQ
jgi:DsbC/DsbD-like thiol-disulfide interchange protein/cytochrome c biogenesis protein CcdA